MQHTKWEPNELVYLFGIDDDTVGLFQSWDGEELELGDIELCGAYYTFGLSIAEAEVVLTTSRVIANEAIERVLYG